MHLVKNKDFIEEYNKYINEHYGIVHFHSTINETIYTLVKRK